MTFVRCVAVRWGGWDPQPGIVEVRLVDVHGVAHRFIHKVPYFGSKPQLGPDTAYPVEVELDCEILDTEFRDGLTVLSVTTERPSDIETVDGRTEFEVSPDQLADSASGSRT
ncbi:hypothetical protein HLB23_30745 [Nocardia uniformis]|uniref:Uncharacterized protein n=1 Tax=Nocardia uniformis TaxID=53432 RepID=A0A849C8W7_9NOCA|nr:hypothetical protein [Nocardia uniformis]NNH74178.1 hypothetical protein [Nocardia uniformis]